MTISRIRKCLCIIPIFALISNTSFGAPAIGIATGYDRDGQTDPLITKERLNDAFIEGLREAGYTIDPTRKTMPAISSEYTHTFRPEVANFRMITAGISLYKEGIVDGKTMKVAVCGITTATWQVGPSVDQHVRAILEWAKSNAAAFAAECEDKR